MTPILSIEELRVEIPVKAGLLKAVRGIDLTIGAGETHGLVGESGSGKSLSALAIMGLLPRKARRSAKTLRFADIDLMALRGREMEDIRGDRIAMVFQDPMTSLNPTFTVGAQLIETLRRHRQLTRAEAFDRALAMLGRVGISSPDMRLRQFPHQLSGGLRQRVMIAMALLCRPKLLIADEPTTALDVTVQAQILRLLADIQRAMGLSILLISHDLGVVARVAHRVSVMYAGQIVEHGDVADVFARPMHPYTRALISSVPVPGKIKRGALLGSIPGSVPNLVGDIAGCPYRPRCTFAHSACAQPPPRQVAREDWAYRCHLGAERMVDAKAPA
jgi:oligopeptide/dipeptide ABC transporter ATP-binding protein